MLTLSIIAVIATIFLMPAIAPLWLVGLSLIGEAVSFYAWRNNMGKASNDDQFIQAGILQLISTLVSLALVFEVFAIPGLVIEYAAEFAVWWTNAFIGFLGSNMI